jgi:signal transduction histidine kinase
MGHYGVVLTAIQDRARLLAWSVALAAVSLALFIVTIVTIVGTALIAVWVGLAIVIAALFVLRPLADLHRRWAAEMLGAPIASPYLQAPTGNLFARLRSMTGEAATWRDLPSLLFNATIGLALSIGAVVEGVLDLILWWLPQGLLQRVDAEITRALLTPTARARLAQRVEHLTESRADTVDSQASELRRIERDLHDGAQARLVSLDTSLGLAEDSSCLPSSRLAPGLAELARNGLRKRYAVSVNALARQACSQ